MSTSNSFRDLHRRKHHPGSRSNQQVWLFSRHLHMIYKPCQDLEGNPAMGWMINIGINAITGCIKWQKGGPPIQPCLPNSHQRLFPSPLNWKIMLLGRPAAAFTLRVLTRELVFANNLLYWKFMLHLHHSWGFLSSKVYFTSWFLAYGRYHSVLSAYL